MLNRNVLIVTSLYFHCHLSPSTAADRVCLPPYLQMRIQSWTFTGYVMSTLHMYTFPRSQYTSSCKCMSLCSFGSYFSFSCSCTICTLWFGIFFMPCLNDVRICRGSRRVKVSLYWRLLLHITHSWILNNVIFTDRTRHMTITGSVI